MSIGYSLRMCARHVDSSNPGRSNLVLRGHPFMTSTRRRGGGQAQVDACGGGGGPAPCGRPHRKLKLESTDVILSSSHAKKLASFYQNFIFGQKKVEIFLRYKLVI